MFQMKKLKDNVISVVISLLLSVFCTGTVVFADDGGSAGITDTITIEVNGSYDESRNTIGQGTLYTGTSLQDAENKVGGNINQLKITGGSVTAEDWKYLIHIDSLENFEIDSSVTTVADMPDLYYNDPNIHLFPQSIKSVNIPQEITIGDMAFRGCNNLVNIELPEATTIGKWAFGGCNSLANVEFPKAITIGNSAFSACSSLVNIEFPEATTIEEWAFGKCSSLVNIEFPKVTSIGDGAFPYCDSLENISFPKVTTIGERAFDCCIGLQNISFPKATTIGLMAFGQCYGLKQVTFSEFPEVTSIGESAFVECSSLVSIELPKVTDIGDGAFVSCQNLEFVSFPEATSIGADAFVECSSLVSIEFPKVTDIGDGAFYDCTSLSKLILGKIPPLIGADAFLHTPKTSNLVLLDTDGTALSGNALIDAKKRYSYVDDSSVIGQQAGDNFWYGWRIGEIVTPSTKFTVIVENGTGGGQYEENDTVTIKANTAPSGKIFDKWIVNSGTVTLANINSATTSFAMPKENITVTAIFKDESSGGSSSGNSSRGGGSNKTYYKIEASANFGGAISPSGTVKVLEDRDKKFTITTNNGYDILDVLVDGKSVGSVTEYEFNDVSKNHTIEVNFKRITPLPQESYYRYNPFIDVYERNWFYNTVLTAYEKGYMTGTSHNVFSPNLDTSRAMIINILYRMEHQPFCYLNNRFNDVSDDNWYAYAIAWGNKNNIIAGYGDRTFKPNQPITREELATILYKYAAYKGYNISTYGMSLEFRDSNKVSSWAMNSVKWSVGNNIISGKGYGILDPGNFATRAETSTMIMNLTDFSERFK